MLGSETGHVDLLVHQCMQYVWVLLFIAILGTNSANGHLRLGVQNRFLYTQIDTLTPHTTSCTIKKRESS